RARTLNPIPDPMRADLSQVLGASWISASPVAGGMICGAARLDTGAGSFFVKWKNDAPPAFFQCEAEGLGLLRSVGALRVPEVVAVRDLDTAPAGVPAYLVLEFLEIGWRRATEEFSRRLGRGLAALHRIQRRQHGLEHDNYLGPFPQSNREAASWVEFYRERRLSPQIELARTAGILTGNRLHLVQRAVQGLEELFVMQSPVPSLLHGDLWSGNVVAHPSGPALVDPAVYFGDREIELAFMQLFDDFPPAVFAEYCRQYPLEAGYEMRRPAHQLYPLLVHLNCFGERYGPRLEEACLQVIEPHRVKESPAQV
ncbi:MAG TPA: fructosamine kinase family protein, partial [Chthonomonadales bacterium]|nr:fructosamine kinase family protein [Chthonomonadales bacterium]